ncbi:TetR/AcrR family transcriptional regulator [Dethiobacter alkaliphilus]|uniref:TetR/AcrR family transcriptional regulator n=1 Tax=Dethiobacter alkaliphilus TaxID=427926 RepID=UPI0022274127|nr:TetR/AcrR family transcriptional regulator [Dethiobacter alkaliphilus]MCW3488810.1 TetR/AcrR family transcriptional regulator [Dethiobacter alkaliphilus]
MKVDKADIFVNARELFAAKGFKDTSISDITKKTGIAVGSFYKFYGAKEEVFLDVFMAESEQLKKDIMAEVDLDDEPVAVIKEATAKMFVAIRENPILREWYSRDVYAKLEKYIYEEDGADKWEDEYSYNMFTGIIKKWQQEGKFRTDIDSDMILAIFNTFQYIDMHKEEIGSQYFPQLMEYMVAFIVKGLQEKN